MGVMNMMPAGVTENYDEFLIGHLKLQVINGPAGSRDVIRGIIRCGLCSGIPFCSSVNRLSRLGLATKKLVLSHC